MSMIDDIKRDREAGTPGPWRIIDRDSMGERCTHYYQEVWNDETDILVTTEVTRAHNDGGTANMRRIARVPDVEAALIEAVEALRIARAEIVDLERDFETLLRGDFVKGRTHEETGDPLLVIEAAIARATGDKP